MAALRRQATKEHQLPAYHRWRFSHRLHLADEAGTHVTLLRPPFVLHCGAQPPPIDINNHQTHIAAG